MPTHLSRTPGHLNEDWLTEPFATGEDAWTLCTTTPTDWHHRDAPIANGLLGIRVNPEGDASGYAPGSCSFMHGMWGAASENPKRPEGMVELPHWATLTICDGDRELRRPQGQTLSHTQSLDLRTATVRTEKQFNGVYASFQSKREAWLSYADKHIGILSAVVDVEETFVNGGRFFISETLDALHIPDLAEATSYVDGEDLCLACTSALQGRRIAIASRLVFTLPEGGSVSNLILATDGAVARRTVRVACKAGDSFKVTKVVAVVSDLQSSEPLAEARRQVAQAAADLTGLRTRHEAAWADIWQSRIEVDHPRLQQVFNAALFYLYSTLRQDEAWSHGPCGLSGNGWDSCIFWDTDLWTLPIYALFNPGMARACTDYRHRTLEGARENARREGEAGARFPWMSGATGAECCSLRVFQEERHIVSCVALGQWVTAVASGDNDYLLGMGYEVIRECADYWLSRAVAGDDGKYHIRNVCGADEHAGQVDDNATTNWGAAWTLRLADTLCTRKGETPNPQWRTVAEALHIPWLAEQDIPKQMEQWQHGQTIKQADASLLVHPWHYPMDDAMKERLVDYYRAHYPEDQIMMGVAIDGVVDCQLGRSDKAWDAFLQLIPHLRRPYLVATESPANERLNFLTGWGGMLQLVVMGFAGMITDEEAALRSAPCLPAAIRELSLIGVYHMGKRYHVTITRDEAGASHVAIAAEHDNHH